MIASTDVPVIFVDAWSDLYVDDRVDDQVIPPMSERDKRFAETLRASRKLEIRELRSGMDIKTTSHVGFLPFEHFSLRIQPKVSHENMLRMMQYAYGIDDFTLYEGTGMTGTGPFQPEELVVAGLVESVRSIVRRGLFQTYVEQTSEEPTVRGSIQFTKLANRLHTSVTLPCRYESRTSDVLPNQLLLAGLIQAQHFTSNRRLSRALAHLRFFMQETVTAIPLTEEAFQRVERELTRLNHHYRPALDLCYLIYQQSSLNRENNGFRHFPGFLMDMNHLFERFIGCLLDDIVPEGYHVEKQGHGSFYMASPGISTPRLRPDFKIFDANGQLATIVDAKYKFPDVNSVDSSDLYQLTIYSMAGNPIWNKAIALYPGSPNVDKSPKLHGDPGDSGLNDRMYTFDGPHNHRQSVVFKRVILDDVWESLTSPVGKCELFKRILAVDKLSLGVDQM